MASTPIRAPRSGAWGDVRSRSIWRWQLIFAASTVAAVVIYTLLSPQMFADALFVAGVIAVVTLTGVSLVIPWHRLPASVVLLLPIADAVAVGLMSQSGQSRASLLWVFPIAWVATYYRLPALLALMTVIAAVLAVDVVRADMAPDQAQRSLILLLCFGFMGVTVNIGARRGRAYRELLRRQLDQIDRVRHRSEQQTRRTSLLADTLETGIAMIDRDGVLLDANLAFLRLYGATAIGDFSPTGAVEYTAFRGAPVPPPLTIASRAAAGAHLQDHRVWLYDPAGTWRALDVSTRPVAAVEPGERPGNLIIVRDVTTAVEAERERQNVASVVSHELRNPLTAITGHVELLMERDDLPADVHRQLAIVDNAGQRMERLITSTLDQFRSEPPTREPVALRALAEASATAFGAVARGAQVQVTTDLVGSCEVDADAFALRQAIDNIVGNAVKYTGRGGTVRLELRADGGVARLTVSDTGIGMSDDDVAQMFDRGFRSPTAKASGIPGTGLGMAQVREVVDAHGGTLHVSSALGRGTTVLLDLPLHVTAPPQNGTP
ncbi:ATP-binding protein [Microbacterium sp. W1N]|uniref:sensor histidine kinase n=1 Tax=Microbacterium festucae TaxID=2977531 RepID=UPI0021C193F6|nr:ATP-binding protein [Microbacterium festucae]MCT9819058.1 ATP-binding protein [Microbacterium festucae]